MKNKTTEKLTEVAPLRTHDIVLREQRMVETVVACAVCGKRRYFARGISGTLALRLYCGKCGAHRTFNIVPKEQWDDFAAWKRKEEDKPEGGKDGI